MEIGYLLLKVLRFYVFKMAVKGGRRFEINMKVQNYEIQFISQKHAALLLLTSAIFVYYVNNHFMGLFQENCSLIRYDWKKINIHSELVTSQHH